jgi:hypothetical protein
MSIKDKSHLHIWVIATLALNTFVAYHISLSNTDLGIGVPTLAHPRSLLSYCFS